MQVKIWRLLPMVLGKSVLLGPVCPLHSSNKDENEVCDRNSQGDALWWTGQVG